MSSHLALGSDGKHNIPHHGAVVHNTQTGEHHQVHHHPVHHQPEHHQPEHKEEEEEDSDSDVEESPMEVQLPYQFTLSLIKQLHKYLPDGHPLQKRIKYSIKNKNSNIVMAMKDMDYLINALKDNNENNKHQKDIQNLEERLKRKQDENKEWLNKNNNHIEI